MLKRLLTLFLAMTLSLTTVACTTGKAGQETSAQLSMAEVKQIAADSVAIAGQAQSYQFDMAMSIKMKMTGAQINMDTSMDGDINGAVDYASKKMMMKADMTVSVPGQGQQRTPVEMYLVDNWAYTRTSVSGQGEHWVKVEVTDALRWQVDAIRPQIDLLAASSEVEYIGEESVDGVRCYVMHVTPGPEALGRWLAQQQLSGTDDLDWSTPELPSFVKEMSYRFWVTKADKQLIKLMAHMLMDLSREDLPTTTPAASSLFQKLSMDLTIDMSLHDYNEPVTIELPPEALAATPAPRQQ